MKHDVNKGVISWEVVGKCLDGMNKAEYQKMFKENGQQYGNDKTRKV